jgi:nitrate reductase NapE component
MTVSIVNDEELAEQEAKIENCKLKLRDYPKKLCKIAKQFQEGFAEQFKSKFKKLKNATFTLVEIDFDKIELLQSRAEQLDLENFEKRTNEFKTFGFLISLIFPIVVSGLNGMYDLITGYHRIKVFKEKFNMKRSWFIVFHLSDDVELTARDKRDMGIVANPEKPEGCKPFSVLDIAYSVVESAHEQWDFAPETKKSLEKKLSPIVKSEIGRYDYEYSAFGFINDHQHKKLKKDVLALALESFEVLTVIDIFSQDDVEMLVKKTQKKAKDVEIIAPKGTVKNWKVEVVRDYSARPGNFELVCNFSCYGSRKEYRKLQDQYYSNYVMAIIQQAWIHWMNELEMGYGGDLKDFETIIKYLREKINFKYFSPMHPDHSKKKLVLVEDEVDVDKHWKEGKAITKIKYDKTFGQCGKIEDYLNV